MKVTLTSIKKRGTDYFMVYYFIPVKEGYPKRVSRFFPKSDPKAEENAKKQKREFEKQIGLLGTSGSLTASQHAEYFGARAILADFPEIDLRDAAKFYAAHAQKKVKDAPIKDMVEKYLKIQKDRKVGKNTLIYYTGHCNALSDKFKNRLVGSLTGNEIINWIIYLKASPITKWSYLGSIERFLNFCVSERVLSINPITDEHKKSMPKKEKVSHSDILTWEQGQALFKAVPLEEKAWFAVQYFTGLRIETGKKLRWDGVDFKERVISIPFEIDKKRQDRFLEGMPDRLWDILNRLPAKYKKGKVFPPTHLYRRIMENARKSAGIDPWPKNALRRSFASHHLNYRNPEKSQDRLTTTLLVMCHTQKPDVFWANYFRRSRPDWADKYFDVDLTKEEKKSLGIR